MYNFFLANAHSIYYSHMYTSLDMSSSIFSINFLDSSNNKFTNFFSASNNTLFHYKGKFSDTGSNAGCLFSFNPVVIIPSSKLFS